MFGLQPGQNRLISPTVCLPSLVGIKEDNSAIVILVCLLKCITLTVLLLSYRDTNSFDCCDSNLVSHTKAGRYFSKDGMESVSG